MTDEELDLKYTIINGWHGRTPTDDRESCSILSDVDRFIGYLDGINLRPGDALVECPCCGKHHSWFFLKQLVHAANSLRTRPPDGIQQAVWELVGEFWEPLRGGLILDD
jgi:hypothetical protein